MSAPVPTSLGLAPSSMAGAACACIVGVYSGKSLTLPEWLHHGSPHMGVAAVACTLAHLGGCHLAIPGAQRCVPVVSPEIPQQLVVGTHYLYSLPSACRPQPQESPHLATCCIHVAVCQRPLHSRCWPHPDVRLRAFPPSLHVHSSQGLLQGKHSPFWGTPSYLLLLLGITLWVLSLICQA